MKATWKTMSAILLSVVLAIGSGCKKETPENSNDDNGSGGGIGGGTAAGVYLGIIGFNDDLATKSISKLNSSTEENFISFIDALTMRDGTALYHADNTALDWLQLATLPSDLVNVSVVTFTDGLDNASMMLNNNYSSQAEFLNAVNNRIMNDRVGGQRINAYAIGMRGNDVQDYNSFRQNLQKLSSSPSNVFEVEDMEAATQRFREIAGQLYNETSTVSTSVKIPGGYDNNTVIRITFDNVNNGGNSSQYIQGTFTRDGGMGKLDNVSYVGLQSTSGTSIVADRQDGACYWYTFGELKTLVGIPITNTDDMRLWRYVSSMGGWQSESEFTPSSYSDVQVERKSAVTVLVLDCTTSLGNDFEHMKTAAKEFVEVLDHYGNNGGGGNGGTVPSIAPFQGAGYIQNGDVLDVNTDYRFGFVASSEIGLASMAIYVNGEEWDNLNLNSTTTYTYSGNFSYSGYKAKDIIGDVTFSAVVFDVQGGGNSSSIHAFIEEIPSPGNEVQYLPYSQDFSESFGTYMTYDVMGSQHWEIDYNTAKMTGYYNNYSYANEDWLISSPVEINGVYDAKMTMVYIGRYFNDINDEITVWASTNYEHGSNPNEAVWTQVPSVFNVGNNWNDFLTTELALTDYIGQTVTFAVKYISSEDRAGTMEIRSITIQEGTATPPTPNQAYNIPYFQSFMTEFGSYLPFSVIGVQSWQIAYNTAKMSGYENGSSYDNEDWLISSPVSITGVSSASAYIVYVAQYTGFSDYDVTLQVSTNYEYGTSPSMATWTQLPVTFPNTNSWNDFQTVEASLNEYIGRVVTIAIKYVSDVDASRTIEIQSISIE